MEYMNEPVAWMNSLVKWDIAVEQDITHDIPLYTQDQLEEARKLGMQQERALWNLSASTQKIMDTHPVKEQEIEKLIGDLRNVAEAQGQKGCWDYDQYMLGLFNGLELALAIFEKREPQYRELPSHPVKELALTDEEMISIYEKDWSGIKCGLGRAVEQAILRKAQEK